MTMSSPKVVRSTLTLLLEVLFEGEVTWGKVSDCFVYCLVKVSYMCNLIYVEDLELMFKKRKAEILLEKT